MLVKVHLIYTYNEVLKIQYPTLNCILYPHNIKGMGGTSTLIYTSTSF